MRTLRSKVFPCTTLFRSQLKDVIMTMEWQWQEKNLTVDLDLGSIEVEGERRLLHQVWMNLLSNAIRYTPAGGRIFMQAKEYEESIEVIISDTGIGIAEEHLLRIFERFRSEERRVG